MQNPYTAREQARWMKPHASLWVRPDAARFLKPGTRLEDVYPALALKYNPNQPRVPSGNPDGGQWTDGEGGGGHRGPALPYGDIDFGDISAEIESLRLSPLPTQANEAEKFVQLAANDGKPILDVFGEPYYRPGGHHVVLQSEFRNWDLPPETRRVFEEATTGKIPRGYTKINGQLHGHYWDDAHRSYRDAFKELSEKFFRDNGIEKRTMTPIKLAICCGKSEIRTILEFEATIAS